MISVMNNEEALKKINQEWINIFPNMLYYEESLTKAQQDKITLKIKKFYLKDKAISEETRHEFANIISDRFFAHGIVKAAQLHANHKHPVYLYYFDYPSTFSLIQSLFSDPGNKFYGLQYI